MKVLLSWLREFAPFEGDPVALGEQMSDLGHGGRGGRPHRARASTASSWPGCSRPAPIEAPTRSSWSTSTPATASRSRSAAARSTWPSGDLVPLATLGTVDARRHGDRPPQDAGVGVQRDAVLGDASSASAATTPGIFLLPADLQPGHAVRRGAGHRAPTCSTTSRSTPTGPTPCRWPASPATWRPACGLPFAIPEPVVDTVPAGADRRRRRSRSSTPTSAVASRPG